MYESRVRVACSPSVIRRVNKPSQHPISLPAAYVNKTQKHRLVRGKQVGFQHFLKGGEGDSETASEVREWRGTLKVFLNEIFDILTL